ncbi:MAG: hypothetical protein ABIE22_04650 [archaeon]
MKKLVIFFILVLMIGLVAVQDAPGLPPELNQDPNAIIDQAKNKTQSEWEYLSQEWKTILLEHEGIAKLDSFFTDISFVFRILFGQPYTLSLTLLFVIILWFIVAIEVARWAKGGSLSSLGIIFGILAAVLAAQLQILKGVITLLGTLIYSPEAKWARLVIGIVAILVIVFIIVLSEFLNQAMKKRKEELAKKDTALYQKGIKKYFKGLRDNK